MARRMARTPDGYAEDLKRSLAPVKKALSAAKELGRNPGWMREAREVVAENNRRIYATSGSAIGANWRGRDYVVSGRLRAELTNPQLLKATIQTNRIYLSPRVKYKKHAIVRFFVIGWAGQTPAQLASRTTWWLARKARGKT